MATTYTNITPSVSEWIRKEIKPVYQQYLSLMRESDNDPEEEPYRSLYSAREKLLLINEKLTHPPSHIGSHDNLTSLSITLSSLLAGNYVSTDETSAGQVQYEKVLESGETLESQGPVAVAMVTACNGLGILWSNRSEDYEKSLALLQQGEALHKSYSSPPPLSHDDWFNGEVRPDGEREKTFEDLHTHTLFYLAQVYGHLDQPQLSASYCQNTLSRQLETNAYDPIDWSLNAATLSQYYINVFNYPQARHCLAAASAVLRRHGDELVGKGEEMKEKVERSQADVSRCWIKYTLSLLTHSTEEGGGGGAEAREKFEIVHRFQPLELEDIEDEVSCDTIENYSSASKVFLFGQSKVQEATKYFTLEEHATDHVSISQDHSSLFKLLASFEPDLSLKCRMHKRRIDLLSPLLSSLNPQHYLLLNRQLMFELGDTLTEMANHKLVLATDESSTPSQHQVNKINRLLNEAIKRYGEFFDSFGTQPVETEFLHSFLTSKLNIARLHSKLLAETPRGQFKNLESSLECYKWLVEYCDSHVEERNGVFEAELSLCKEMVTLLPQKMELIRLQNITM